MADGSFLRGIGKAGSKASNSVVVAFFSAKREAFKVLFLFEWRTLLGFGSFSSGWIRTSSCRPF